MSPVTWALMVIAPTGNQNAYPFDVHSFTLQINLIS
jgi:hypothetical protein